MTLTRVLITVVAILGGLLTFLCFAPPQSHKWIYMWQAYVIERNVMTDKHQASRIWNRIPPPPGYSGRWVTWDKKGLPLHEADYLNGIQHGHAVRYFGGEIYEIRLWSQGVEDDNFRKDFNTQMQDGKRIPVCYVNHRIEGLVSANETIRYLGVPGERYDSYLESTDAVHVTLEGPDDSFPEAMAKLRDLIGMDAFTEIQTIEVEGNSRYFEIYNRDAEEPVDRREEFGIPTTNR